MRLDKLPVGEAIVGFLLVALIAAFIVGRHEVSPKESAEAVDGSPTASAGPSGSTAPGQVEVTMHDNSFDNTTLTLAAGTDVSIPLTNAGTAVHNMHVASDSGEFTEAFCTVGGAEPCSDPNRLAGGATGTLDFTVPNTPGSEIKYRCDFHPTEMTGTITVQ